MFTHYEEFHTRVTEMRIDMEISSQIRVDWHPPHEYLNAKLMLVIEFNPEKYLTAYHICHVPSS